MTAENAKADWHSQDTCAARDITIPNSRQKCLQSVNVDNMQVMLRVIITIRELKWFVCHSELHYITIGILKNKLTGKLCDITVNEMSRIGRPFAWLQRLRMNWAELQIVGGDVCPPVRDPRKGRMLLLVGVSW